MIDLDDEIRDAISAERDGAPLPVPWHEVVARSDRRQVHRRRPLMLAVAAVAIVSALGLVATLVIRGDRADQVAQAPATDVPDVDPLDGLTADQWVVPDPIPEGYERVNATSMQDGKRTVQDQVFVADGVPEVSLHVEDPRDERDRGRTVTPVTIDGIEWSLHVADAPGRSGDVVELWRNVGDRFVWLQTVGSPDEVERFARSLVSVPSDEIDFEYLDADGPYTDVVTITHDDGEAILRVRGLDGYYCTELEDTAGEMRGRSGCGHTTTSDQPIVQPVSISDPDGSLTGVIIDPTVASIEVRRGDDVSTVVPRDESGQFEHGFWIFDGGVPTDVAVEFDDGTRVELERTGPGGWQTVESASDGSAEATTDESVDPLAGLTADDWVVPDPIPDGYERLIAEVSHEVEGQDVAKQVQVFGDGDAAEVWLQVMGARTNAGDAEGEVELAPDEEPLTVDGIEWYRREWGSTDGPPFVTMWRNAGDRRVSLESLDDPDALERFARALVVVPESALEFDVLDPDGPYTDVARSTRGDEDVVLRVRGLNGYYCVEYEDGDMRGRSGCSSTTSPDQPINEISVSTWPERSLSYGLAAPDVARFEVDHEGDLTVVEPTDESEQFEHGFWIMQSATDSERSVGNADAVTIELDDGTRVDLEQTELGIWRVPNP